MCVLLSREKNKIKFALPKDRKVNIDPALEFENLKINLK